MSHSALEYPFPEGPGTGQAISITPDVKWLRSPLPMSLNHINCYLLRDGDGWCVVDTGMNSEAARQQWLNVLEAELNGAPLTRVIVTHHHPDHIGLAGWLCDDFRIPLYMTEAEYFYTRTFNAANVRQTGWEVEQFFDRAGISKDHQQSLFNNSDYNHVVTEMPASYHRLRDGQRIRIGEHEWEAITTRGHAPEHMCLYCRDLDLLISGDQVLPKITSNVSVQPTEPNADPLADWYDAHVKMARRVPDSVLVLPAHQLPFRGLHQRLLEVIAHHEERLDKIEALCDSERNAQELTDLLFGREMTVFQNFLAVGECIAHLHRLLALGRIERRLQDGTYRFRRVSF